jgi:hypothetical protein
MLPLVCNDAVAILFMFDLSRKSTLNSVKEWYRQARGFNKVSRADTPFTLIIVNIFRLQYRFLLGLSLTRSQHFRGMNKKRSQNRYVYLTPERGHALNYHIKGKAVCESHARVSDILLDIGVHQCTKDL